MSRMMVALLAGALGASGSMLVLPVSEANAAFCARPPAVSTQGCQQYRCIRRGPCQIRANVVDRRGCLRYICTAMRAPGGIPGVPIDKGGPRPPREQPR